MDSIVSSMDMEKSSAVDDVDSTPDSDVSSGSEKSAPAVSEEELNSGQNVSSSDCGDNGPEHSVSGNIPDIQTSNEDEATPSSDMHSENSSNSVSSGSENQVSQSSVPEPMDTA